MPLRARTVVLAVAALGAVAFATVRIARAAEQNPTVAEQTRPEREATPGQAAATLAMLHSPPGFRRVTKCRFAEAGAAEKCFWSPRGLVLDARTLERVSASWPARAGMRPNIDGCYGPHRAPSGIVLGHCNWELEIGRELVLASMNLLEVPSGPPTPKVAQALRYWRRGTEIRLRVIGHWRDGKAPPETRL
jgi:hypothetical protein